MELGMVARVALIISPHEGAACNVPILNYNLATHTMETNLTLISC
jgi:hypothetical protein